MFPFLFLKASCFSAGTHAGMCVPSIAPTQCYKKRKKKSIYNKQFVNNRDAKQGSYRIKLQ